MVNSFLAESVGSDGYAIKGPAAAALQAGAALIALAGDQIGFTSRPVMQMPAATPTPGQVLAWNGSSWEPSSVSAGTPGGTSGQLQYNNGGAFAGLSSSSVSGSDLSLGGKLTLPLGSSIEFGTLAAHPKLKSFSGVRLEVLRYDNTGYKDLWANNLVAVTTIGSGENVSAGTFIDLGGQARIAPGTSGVQVQNFAGTGLGYLHSNDVRLGGTTGSANALLRSTVAGTVEVRNGSDTAAGNLSASNITSSGILALTSTTAARNIIQWKDDGAGDWIIASGGVASTDGFRITKQGVADIVAFRPSLSTLYTPLLTTGTITSRGSVTVSDGTYNNHILSTNGTQTWRNAAYGPPSGYETTFDGNTLTCKYSTFMLDNTWGQTIVRGQAGVYIRGNLSVRDISDSAPASVTAGLGVFSSYVTSAYQTLSANPTVLDLAVGNARVIRNSSLGTVALWINQTGTPEIAQSNGLSTVAVDGVTITGNGTPGSPLVASGGGGGGSSSIPTLMSW